MKPVKIRYIKSNCDFADLILKIYKNGNKYRYTVQYGDGPDGNYDTLTPFLESGYVYPTLEKAELEAEYAIGDYFDNEE